LYLKHKEDHDLEYAREEGSDGKGDPLNVHEFHLTRSVEESKAINNVKTSCIIISASGMVSGGRVLHHLVQRLPDARNAVILAGFQAEGNARESSARRREVAESLWAARARGSRDHRDGGNSRRMRVRASCCAG